MPVLTVQGMPSLSWKNSTGSPEQNPARIFDVPSNMATLQSALEMEFDMQLCMVFSLT